MLSGCMHFVINVRVNFKINLTLWHYVFQFINYLMTVNTKTGTLFGGRITIVYICTCYLMREYNNKLVINSVLVVPH